MRNQTHTRQRGRVWALTNVTLTSMLAGCIGGPVEDVGRPEKGSLFVSGDQVQSDWGSGYCRDIHVTNGTAEATSWMVAVPVEGRVRDAWNVSWEQHGDRLVARGVGWSEIMQPGQTLNWGFCADRDSASPGGEGPTDSPPVVEPTGTTPAPQGTPPSGEPDDGAFTARGSDRAAMATHFDGLGFPTGGCGVPQDLLETQHFVALNVQNSPGDYGSFLARPIEGAQQGLIGEFDNGRNCGRWIQVTLGEWCSGNNSGVPGTEFCQGGSWQGDEFTGATLNFIVADSCQDGNRWCRDDRYHLDLATASLTHFRKDGRQTSGLPNRWSNRRVSWRYIEAPNYQGDIRIGFRQDAQRYWPAIVITSLRNGIHGVEEQVNGAWRSARMVSDNGQVYELTPNDAMEYRIRVRDAQDTLINQGRTYRFRFPATCGEHCSAVYTPVSYTTE